MRPEIALERDIVTANALAWRAFAGVPVRAVVKGAGYGWGYETVVGALEGHVSAFCVADESELQELRRYTATNAIVLGHVPAHQMESVLHMNALPSIGTAEELAIAQRFAAARGERLHVRVGVRPAASWSGLSIDELRNLAGDLFRAGATVEVWGHVTDWENRSLQTAHFRACVALLENAGVHVSGTDLSSTFPLAADGAQGTAVRVGIGLFGATGGAAVPGVRCALRVRAAVTRIERVKPGSRVGYGADTLDEDDDVATARCGYADGLPKDLAGSDGLLSIGMQYVTARVSRLNADRSQLVLLDETTNLDAFAAQAGRLPHEIVTAFGNAACANAAALLYR